MVIAQIREFLESSTIHGLVHISTGKSRTATRRGNARGRCAIFRGSSGGVWNIDNCDNYGSFICATDKQVMSCNQTLIKNIKHTKKLKEIPSRQFLENLPEKASIYAFIHLKLIGNLQGFCQYIMADMLNLTIADYRKYSAIVFLGP